VGGDPPRQAHQDEREPEVLICPECGAKWSLYPGRCPECGWTDLIKQAEERFARRQEVGIPDRPRQRGRGASDWS
jgi:predicted ATP-dependent serine protease